MGRLWGYVVFVGLIVAWLSQQVPAVLLLFVAIVEVLYFLFRVPLWCGAETRRGLLCRNNSSGLLLGCHLRQHKWQRLKGTFVLQAWRRRASVREALAGVGLLCSTILGVVSVARL